MKKKIMALAATAFTIAGCITVADLAVTTEKAEAVTFCNITQPTSIRGFNDNCTKGAYFVKALGTWTRMGACVGWQKWAYNDGGQSFATRAVGKG